MHHVNIELFSHSFSASVITACDVGDDPYSLCSLMASFTTYLTRPISSEVLHSVGRVVNCKSP
ncbi:MAG TPA: hypothetical protein EYQ52_08120 [Candidatus Thioglobus sp.]|nr:hypothetical protein [Candidatus Thioglobus sp.]